MRRSFLKLALAGLVTATAACSLILGSSSDQCSTDGDCARFAAYPVCSQGVCVARVVTLPDGNVTGDSPAPPPPPDVDNGCPPVPPDAQIDFANACTTGQCIDFDNCARLQLCGDAALPDVIPPPAPPPPDAGPDVNDSATD